MGISRDRFARKVIVSISLMYKEGDHGIVKTQMDGRDALWTLDNNAPVGREITNQLQTSFDSQEPEAITAPSRATPDKP